MALPSPVAIKSLDLSERFPGAVTPDTRPGYSGWIVEKGKLLEVAATLDDAAVFLKP